MEGNYLDEMYGDFNRGPSDSPLASDDNSVDIYSGLDNENSPHPSGGTEKSRALFSPKRLKDSLDLYEEILTEEQKEREATYNDLKTKLDETQNQLKELLQKLQQMQTQNLHLHNENTHLKKNICALIKTARMEIVRKDDEINRLNQRSVRGGFGQSFPRPLFSQQRNCITRPSTDTTGTASTAEVREPRVNCATRDGNQQSLKDRHGFVQTCGTSVVDASNPGPGSHKNIQLPTDSLTSNNQCIPAGTNCKKDSRSLEPLSREEPGQNSKSCLENIERRQNVTQKRSTEPQEIRDAKHRHHEERSRRTRADGDCNKEGKTREREKTAREHKESEKDGTKSNRRRNQYLERDLEPPRRSGRGKSPTLDCSQRTTTSLHSSKNRARDSEVQMRSNSQDQERCDKRVHESSGKEGKRTTSSHQSRHRDKCLSASSSRRGDRSPLREDHRKEERRRDEEKKGRQEKSKEQDRTSEKTKDRSESKNDEEKKQSESHVKSSSHKNVSVPGKLTNPDNTAARKTAAEKKIPPAEKDSPEKCFSESDIVSVSEGNPVKRAEETSSVRKLSFMETLNLTLSPVKKPKQSSENQDEDIGHLEEGPLEGQEKESSLFDLEENYCVIDEVETSCESVEHSNEVLAVPGESSVSVSLIEESLHSDPVNDGKEPLTSAESGPVQTRTIESEDGGQLDQGIVTMSVEMEVPTETVELEAKGTGLESTLSPKGSDTTPETEAPEILSHLPNESVNADAPNNGSDTVNKVADQVKECTSIAEIDKPSVTETRDVEANDTVAEITQNLSDVTLENPDEHDNGVQMSIIAVQNQTGLLNNASSATTGPQDNLTNREDCDMSTDTVSSTVCIETEPQSVNIEAVSDNLGTVVSSLDPEKAGEKDECDTNFSPRTTEISKVSSTLGSEIVSADQGPGSSPKAQESNQTPAETEKTCCNSEPDSTEAEKMTVEPSPSKSLPGRTIELELHDEDSMMVSLKSIRHISEVISPLTSPIRPMRKSPKHVSAVKLPYVKSLSKDLSSVTEDFSLNSTMMGVNKENQKPEFSSTECAKKDYDKLPSSSEEEEEEEEEEEDEDEIEEGEIISDSEGEELPVIISPPHKNASPGNNVRKVASPKADTLGKRQHNKSSVTQGSSGKKSKVTSPPVNSSPSNKRRFRTVLPFLPKTDPSSIQDVMDMLKFIRKQIRKKYMKLQKSFPVKTFYSIIDMSLWEFTDFVNNLNCTKLCNSEKILKPKLCKIISATLKKISNNGIVNRIFEQQSPNLKKKLWMFVEDQFDFLFKELQTNLISMCKSGDLVESSEEGGKQEAKKEKDRKRKAHTRPVESLQPPVNIAKRNVVELTSKDAPEMPAKIKSPTKISLKTGLGSRGKNLRLAMETDSHKPEAQLNGCPEQNQDLPGLGKPSTVTPSKNVSLIGSSAPSIGHASVHDKSDFEILTEQQASSLTFNLVTDSQMGEIFKCLLQGSDLLEQSVPGGDNHGWPIGTPRKEAPCEESLQGPSTPHRALMALRTPTGVPWSTVTPEKFSSFSTRIGVPLNPAALDESCMLEVPSNVPFHKMVPSTHIIQRPYSLLAEDLAVSLTIPSPLKSDGHLSFLQPVNGEMSSAPQSILRAHYSEDALLDGEDATEQDIHLALDSDNSSSRSGSGGSWQDVPPVFQFKPHLPMQAVVMEKSNDHFVVRIRHTSTEPDQSDSVKPPEIQPATDAVTCSTGTPTAPSNDETNVLLAEEDPSKLLVLDNSVPDPDPDVNCMALAKEPSIAPSDSEGERSTGPAEKSSLPTEEPSVPDQPSSAHSAGKKRKRHHSERVAKKAKTEVTQKGQKKQKKKKKSKDNPEKGTKSPKMKTKTAPPPASSPNSLSAKNVIKKKGEVVVAWTRDDDRTILVELKKKGASEKTFSSLSRKLNKLPAQIAERFCQLMKLFKKKERMDS